MSLADFLRDDSVYAINELYKRLAEQAMLVDDYKDLIARFRFITEVINNRYPDGIPCQDYVNSSIEKRDADDLDEKPERPHDCEEFMRRAAQVEVFVFERDKKFVELQETYLNDLLEANEYTFRLSLMNYREYKKYVDERWPKNMTVHNRTRQRVEARMEEAIQRPLNFTGLGLGAP